MDEDDEMDIADLMALDGVEPETDLEAAPEDHQEVNEPEVETLDADDDLQALLGQLEISDDD